MWYAIISEDNENSLPLRATARERHIERLRALAAEGRLLIAGPHPAVDAEDAGEDGITGSLVVAEFACLEDARQWADDDPYVAVGVYREVSVKPFKLVLP